MSVIIFGDGADSLNWEDARGLVLADLWRVSAQGLPNDVIDRGLHTSLRRLESVRRWLWLESVHATIEAQSDTDILQLPANVKAIASLAHLSSTTHYEPLVPKRLAEIRMCARGSRPGWPTNYCFHGGKIYLDNQVNVGANFELICKTGVPANLATAIITPSITLDLQRNAVIAAACAWIALTRLKNEAESQRHEIAYQQYVELLMDEEDEARGDETGGVIRPDSSYHMAAFG